jgi:hypothetical protein
MSNKATVENAIWYIQQAIFECSDIAYEVEDGKRPVEDIPDAKIGSLLLQCIDLLNKGATSYHENTMKKIDETLHPEKTSLDKMKKWN